MREKFLEKVEIGLARKIITKPPSAYLPRLYFDSITHSSRLLELLCATAGSDAVLTDVLPPEVPSETVIPTP